MSSRLRTVLLVAIGVGVVAGILAAVLIPTTRSRAISPRPPVAPLLRVAPPRHQPGGPDALLLRVHRASVRIEARTADPLGGPPWALRVFLADRVAPAALRHPGAIIGHNRCVQLGRIYRGTFGWVDATETFRPVTFGPVGAPFDCVSPRPDLGREPLVQLTTLLNLTVSAHPTIAQGVVWGLAGQAATKVRVRVAGRTITPRRAPDNPFLIVSRRAPHPGQVLATFRYPRGHPIRIRPGAQFRQLPFFRVLRVEPTDVIPRIEARTADPNAGLPWGVSAVPSTAGGWCVTDAGRIVEDRVGLIQPHLGTFEELVPTPQGCVSPDPRLALSHARPFRGEGIIGLFDSDPTARQQEIERRTLPGLTVESGFTRPDVDRLTIQTPRDIRTLQPSPRAHAFIVVYDGTFPTGEFIVTAHFRDGTTSRTSFPLGGP
jgi:hypothetical protein